LYDFFRYTITSRDDIYVRSKVEKHRFYIFLNTT